MRLFKKASKSKDNGTLAAHFTELASAQDEIILKVQSKKKYEIDEPFCAPIDFTKSTNIEYIDNVFVRDLSTDEQTKLGLNIFHVKVDKTTSSPIHSHDQRAQLIYVKKGVIFDKVARIRFEAGDSFFISKRNKHSVKYTKGSEILFIYVPGLVSNNK